MRVARQRWVLLLALTMTLGVWGTTRADWNPGDPAKWVQTPDLNSTGMDVNATFRGQQPFIKILADDWRCTSQDPVSDIHIWGSWLADRLPPNGPCSVPIKLSIHDDIPADAAHPYSRPGIVRWQKTFLPGEYTCRRYPNATYVANEYFYEPNTDQIIGRDTQVYQYNFTNFTNPPPFIQEGTPGNPRIYWLSVQVNLTAFPDLVFGWKTSLNHNLDDAVYGDTTAFAGPPFPQFPPVPLDPWKDMHYPPGHPMVGQTLDLAFVITAPSSIPTVSEWGLIVMTIMLLTAGTLILARRRLVLAGTGGADVGMGPMGRPFAPRVFAWVLGGTLLAVAIGCVAAQRINGELATRDIIGSVISGTALAYLVHLWILLRRKGTD